VNQLRVAQGFKLNVFAENLEHARMLAVSGSNVYVTRPDQGDVLRLRDTDGDGDSDVRQTVVSGQKNVHGIYVDGTTLYLATVEQVFTATIENDGTVGTLTSIIDDLPSGGQHPYRTLAIGPDDQLYISIGSTCDACQEPDEEHATILRSPPTGSTRETRSVFAEGLRNTIGFGWHPTTRDMWGMDNGSDWRGDDLPPEELNRIERDNNYGWPFCFGEKLIDPIIEDPKDTTKAAYCAASTAPVVTSSAHEAPIALTFYDGTAFPEEFRDDAFVALHGSWNRFPPTGYRVARIEFEAGAPARIVDFVSGFLIEEGRAHFGRPAGIAVAADGALLFTDDTNGVLYRASHEP
jgi:glucose/arabinose dehydrogenase